MNAQSKLRIGAIAASLLLLLSVISLESQSVQAQPISACTAILGEEDQENDLGIYDGVGTEFYTRYYGSPGDRVSILQGDRDGLAIANDKYGNNWVKVELLQSQARGWVRRDNLSEFECYNQGKSGSPTGVVVKAKPLLYRLAISWSIR
ncbi:MAG: hypothetical protein J7545_05455 [Roseofilum sp. SBFL]|uniref:hypothetical protein n=1 Tax=unclassified Roseofilum TaxID=2620099 RepID=UPI001B13A549|nr:MULTISPECIES: hypothetical protein [unclassified Roseofilum]MBP0015022.1 hypothetical protein [Roseofilum sp. SID3]MBP0024538.1 hypothetical protein [Roseofilum sp. SID2]MBP0037306.1 hypothetical protein [Roseofilum sp. SID1]MBP0041409.1 hypothetical protein [Roseofilum sp. SBFL]